MAPLARATNDALSSYLAAFAPLFGDTRTRRTFAHICFGLLAAGSLLAARIGAHAPRLARLCNPSQPVLRFATGDSAQRSPVSPTALTAYVAQHGVDTLTAAPPGTDIWLVL